MNIENSKATGRAKLLLIRLPLLAVLVILVLTMLEVFPSATILIIFAGIFILTLLTVLVGRLHYINISIKKTEVLIRHYHLFPLLADYQELLVQKSDNPEFLIRYSFFGFIPVLYINIYTSKGKAVYPAVPLGLLSKDEVNNLKKELDIK
jgi:hypothetical protein